MHTRNDCTRSNGEPPRECEVLLPDNWASAEEAVVYPIPNTRSDHQESEGNQIAGKQGCEFCFLNRHLEPYKWTNAVPEDDPEIQGLLEEEEPAAYPNMSAKLPGVEIESEEEGFQVVTNEPVPEFADLAATALDNAKIDPNEHLCRAHKAAADRSPGARLPAIVKANEDDVINKITFTLSDAELGMNAIPLDEYVPDNAHNDVLNIPIAMAAAAAASIPDVVPDVATG